MKKTAERIVNVPKGTQTNNNTLPTPKQPFVSKKVENNPLGLQYKGIDMKNGRKG